MHEAVALPKAIKSHARPSRQVVVANLIVAHREAHKRQLIHDALDAEEIQSLLTQVWVAAAVG